MKRSIQNLIQELTAVIFEKDELDFREMSGLRAHSEKFGPKIPQRGTNSTFLNQTFQLK